jgi:hypothetical protein
MGRIVYFSFPAHGHINPTLPVIRELSGRGEQISYFSTLPFASSIAETGAQFCPYTERVQMPAHGPGPFAHLTTTLETLLEFCGAVLDRHLDTVRRWRPTHVMFDSFAPWGRMMAQLLGLPAIASVPSILINRAIDERYGGALGSVPAVTAVCWVITFPTPSPHRNCCRPMAIATWSTLRVSSSRSPSSSLRAASISSVHAARSALVRRHFHSTA